MILLLGASGYVGRRLFGSLDSSQTIGTHCSNPVPGSVLFDATHMRVQEIIPAETSISHALIVYAEADVDACKANLQRSRQMNVVSTKRVIDDLSKLGIKPVFMSSEYVFDGEKGNYSEDDAAHPNTVYGTQKLEIERYLHQNCEDYAVLRLAKVYGTDPDDKTILSGWTRQIRAGEEIRCARDQVFSPVHVDDVVAATEAVISLDLNGVFHIASTEPYSRLAMLRQLLASLDAEARVTECSIGDFDFLDRRPLDLSLDPRKVLAATGLEFRTVEECCRELVGRVHQSLSGRVAASG